MLLKMMLKSKFQWDFQFGDRAFQIQEKVGVFWKIWIFSCNFQKVQQNQFFLNIF